MIHSTHLLRLSAVIRHGSMRQAAVALNISQPALSQSIREIEEIVGSPLFERTPRGLRVTASGLQLGIHADIVANELQRTAAAIARLRTGSPSHFAIGASASICASALPSVCHTLTSEGFASDLHVFEGMAGPLVDRLSRGVLDVVVTYLWNVGCAEDGLDFEQVGVSEIGVVCHEPTAMAIRNGGLGLLSAHPWVVMSKSLEMKQRFENFFASASVPRPERLIESDSITFALRLMQRENYIAFMPLGHAHVLDAGRFVTLEINGMTWARGVGVFYRKRAHHAPALRRLVELLRAHYVTAASGTLRRLPVEAP